MPGIDIEDQDANGWRDPEIRLRARDEPALRDRHLGRRAPEPVLR
jgi:hypothetical protein